jgi:hypothetical protein
MQTKERRTEATRLTVAFGDCFANVRKNVHRASWNFSWTLLFLPAPLSTVVQSVWPRWTQQYRLKHTPTILYCSQRLIWTASAQDILKDKIASSILLETLGGFQLLLSWKCLRSVLDTRYMRLFCPLNKNLDPYLKTVLYYCGTNRCKF